MRNFSILLHGHAVDAANELEASINAPTPAELMAALTNALLRIDSMEKKFIALTRADAMLQASMLQQRSK